MRPDTDSPGRESRDDPVRDRFRRRGHSYLFADDGYLFQSPISWYSGRHVLDLSPGYRDRNSHFDRPVDANCLFCHANHAEPLKER